MLLIVGTARWNGTYECSPTSYHRKPGYVTLDDCKTACYSLPGCVAVDYAIPDGGCWLQTNTYNYNYRPTNSSYCVSYVLDCARWSGSYECSPSSYDKRSNLTLNHCKAACYWTPGCVAVDHVASANECWIQTKNYNFNYRPDIGNCRSYVLDARLC